VPPAVADTVPARPRVPEPPAPAITLTVSPSTIESGAATMLTWEARNATTVTIEPAIGSVGTTGSREVQPTSSVTYTATAIGPGGRATDSVRVTVNVRPTPAPAAPDAGPSVDEMFRRNMQNVLFDFDRAEIRTDQVSNLRAGATWLNANPTIRFTIEGHADERGTQEYNVGLGQLRATAVRQFLITEGVSSDRIETISYGEERPSCSLQTETCWQANRRASFSRIP
jgi:peptidoglycan-associated lipoprotein